MLKGALFPVRDAIAGLIRADAPFVRAETKVYLNDTLDHSISLIEMVETQRDMLTGLIEMHLSLIQARTNEIISFLTIVSAIFIPLTFIVGVWGMNFDPASSPWNMPELRGLLWISDGARLHGGWSPFAGRFISDGRNGCDVWPAVLLDG